LIQEERSVSSFPVSRSGSLCKLWCIIFLVQMFRILLLQSINEKIILSPPPWNSEKLCHGECEVNHWETWDTSGSLLHWRMCLSVFLSF